MVKVKCPTRVRWSSVWLLIMVCICTQTAMAQQASAPSEGGLAEAWDAVQEDHLRKADIAKNKLAAFQMGRRDTDEFLVQRINDCVFGSHDMAGREARVDRIRIRAVFDLNGPRACIWMVCHDRQMKAIGRAVPLNIGVDQGYREWSQYVVNTLLDTAIPATGSARGRLAPFPVYEDRLCDYAYKELRKTLSTNATLARISKRMNAPWPLPNLDQEMSYEERDRHINRLWSLLSSADGKKVLISFPSALKELRELESASELVTQAERIMAQHVFRLDIAEEAKGVKSKRIEMLDGEIPPLNAQEMQIRKRLLGKEYSAADVAARLPQETAREQGLIEWSLLNRTDHKNVADALLDLAKQKKALAIKLDILKLAGDLAHAWGTADPGSQVLIQFMNKAAADESEHWTIRVQAANSISKCKVDAKDAMKSETHGGSATSRPVTSEPTGRE